jgi:hypothetical protein
MAKFITVKERRSDRALARHRPTNQGRPLGGNFEEPFAEDGEDDGFSEPVGVAAQQLQPAEEAPQPEIQPWMPHRIAVDSIRSVTPRLNGQPGGRIVLKNEKNIITIETFEELEALMDAP